MKTSLSRVCTLAVALSKLGAAVEFQLNARAHAKLMENDGDFAEFEKNVLAETF
jgi:hypothetical protein